MEQIFSGHGIEIHRQDNLYFLTYEAGEIAVKYKTIKISLDAAIQAQESAEAAYWVIINYENIEQFGEDYMNQWQQNHGGQ